MHSSNEHRNFISAGNEHSNSNSVNTGFNKASNLEGEVCDMVVCENKEGETLHSGHIPDILFNSERIEGDDKTSITGVRAGLTAEEMLDSIQLSDEEEGEDNNLYNVKMTPSNYHHEMKKITELYEEDDGTVSKYTGTRNEIEERKEIPLPFDLSEGDVLMEAGMVDDLIGDNVIIRANVLNGILDLDNILFNDNKLPVGYLDDVIGKVESPIYIVKFFPNYDESKRQGLSLVPGKSLYFAKDKGKQIVTNVLLRHRGCDASNAFDEEIAKDEMEFSDDEEEAARKAMRKRERLMANSMNKDNSISGGISSNMFEKKTKKQKVSQDYLPQYDQTSSGNPYLSNEYKLGGENNANNLPSMNMNMNMNMSMNNPMMYNFQQMMNSNMNQQSQMNMNMNYFQMLNSMMTMTGMNTNPHQNANNLHSSMSNQNNLQNLFRPMNPFQHPNHNNLKK